MSRGNSPWWWYRAANMWRKLAGKRIQRKALSHYRKLGFSDFNSLKDDIGTHPSAWVTSFVRSHGIKNGPEFRAMINERDNKTKEIHDRIFGDPK